MVNQKNDEKINPWPSPFLHDIAVLTHMLPGPFLSLPPHCAHKFALSKLLFGSVICPFE